MSLENIFVLSAHGRIIDEVITIPSNTYVFFLSDKKDYCYSDQDEMFIKCICKWISKIKEHDNPEELEKKKYYQFVLKLFLFKSERDLFLEHLQTFNKLKTKYKKFMKMFDDVQKTSLSEIDIFLFKMILKIDDKCDSDENESIKNMKKLQSRKKFDKIEKNINRALEFLIIFWDRFSISEIALPRQSILDMSLDFFTKYKNFNTEVTIFKSGSIKIDNYLKPDDNYSFTFKNKNPTKYLESLLSNFGKMKLNDIIQRNESGYFFKQHSKEEIKSIMESKPDKAKGFTEQKKINMVLPSMVLNAMENDTSKVKTEVNYKINEIVDLCNRKSEKCLSQSPYFMNIFNYKLSQILESNKIYFVHSCRIMNTELKKKEDEGVNPPEYIPTFEEINSKSEDDVFKQFIKSFLS